MTVGKDVHDHITGMAEEIEVQATAPKASSQKVGRIPCCWFCHVPRHTKKSCPYWRAQAWRNRMAGVKRRKQTVSLGAVGVINYFELILRAVGK